jgi:uncharacterized delta-60 repeat protein
MNSAGANSFLLCLLTVATGCTAPSSGPERPDTEGGTTQDGSTGGSSTSDSTSSSSAPGSSEESGSSSGESSSGSSESGSSSGEPLLCGNGALDEGEVCDDGNDIDGDGCNVDCIESGTVLDAWIHDDDPAPSAGPGAVKIGPDGSFVIAGFVNRSELGQGYDAWIRKYAEDGTIAWTDEYNNALADSHDAFWGVDIDDDGDIVVTGSEDRVDIGEGENAVLRRYDADGNQAWTVTYNTADADGNDEPYGVGFDSAGDIFVGGSIVRTDLGQSQNFWVARYDGGGANDWMTTYDNPAHLADTCLDFEVDDEGNGYCAGYSDRGDLGQSLDAFLLKTTPEGDTAWTHTYDAGNGNSETLWAVGIGPDSEVVVAGGIYTDGQSDALIRKLDANGDEVWTQTYAGKAGLLDLAVMLAVDRDGNVIVGGYEATAGGSATWVRKLDPDGNELWTDAVDLGPGNERAADADVWPDGRILVTGSVDQVGDNQINNIWVRIYAP